MGGLNYQINLLNALLARQSHRITPVLFLGEDVEPSILERYHRITGLVIVRDSLFNQQKNWFRLFNSMLSGIDYSALKLFEKHEIDVAFESASFYGWRFPLKVLAWIPDLQHQRLKHYFGFLTFWKREIGFRMQLLGKRHIMLSSEDAKRDFQHFYHTASQRLHVARFAVPVQVPEFDDNHLKVRYELPDQFFYLPNQFWRHKNHECVIRALAIAKQSGHSLTVVATGNLNDPRDSEHFPNLTKLINSLGLENNFKVLGLIPYQDVQALMMSCIALINPSRFEGWSTTVEEAKALNLDMILSDINVHKEQAGTKARFFNADDTEGLAKILIDIASRPSEKHLHNTNDIGETSLKNMADFAECFTNIVYKVTEPV
ncbi:Glycosyltransferase involved in cell wall bisynthesis [Methylophilus rhizosphaerae]|uniref:Glycosyltransferase involved in cell wall bisynthesis n=2 Tax=Methylophilus rhizosphaerae TaxID=492660 RepID=A0A1G8ZAU8_9PROT|nr:Glycosyltransferase involved in cell wall bisynthesis [Methylophilus rhizosphaerae]